MPSNFPIFFYCGLGGMDILGCSCWNGGGDNGSEDSRISFSANHSVNFASARLFISGVTFFHTECNAHARAIRSSVYPRPIMKSGTASVGRMKYPKAPYIRALSANDTFLRSEERRVGKEC